MTAIKNVLIATDFSEPSIEALAYGRQLAHAFSSRLHILHVTGDIAASAGTEMYGLDVIAMQQEVDAAARRQLDAIVTPDDRRTLDVETVLRTSNSPAQQIVAYARDASIDLIVLGTHGRGGMAHLLLGSVAERVVRTAPCPVLTVRDVVTVPASTQAAHVVAHA
jgi:nucleotide-binding universal stress UspA family protein